MYLRVRLFLLLGVSVNFIRDASVKNAFSSVENTFAKKKRTGV